MRKSAKTRFLAVITAMAMIMTLIPVTAFAAEGGAVSGIQLRKPSTTEDGVSTWDCVYFGKYPQSSDGNAGFKTEPIKWRVLEVTDTNDDGIADDAFLLSDRNLDAQPYNAENKDVTWETCSLRKWLNDGDFMLTAFTYAEQAAIKKTDVVNNDNPDYGTEGGNNTEDKVYLLSIDEIRNEKYGFVSEQTRIAKNTAYATEKEAYTDNGAGNWWLRSPGNYTYSAAFVYNFGFVYDYGYYVNFYYNAARPALHLNLKSSCWAYAGTVNSNGTEITGITDVTLSETNFAHTGGAITPTVVVKSGADELVKDTDYTVAYSNNIDPGTATITITGIGSYTGVITKTFTITAPVVSNPPTTGGASTPAVNVTATNISKLTKAKKAFTVKWKKSTASNATGYQVRYSTKASMAGAKTKTIKGWKNTSKKITKLKAKKKYYVQVRTYRTVSGTNYYSDWSAKKSVKTK